MTSTRTPRPDHVWTVSDLTQQIRRTLQSAFGPLWVEAEISNFSRSGSGHCYLTLKDEQSQLRGVIWRDVACRIPFELSDGLQVLVQGTLDVYAGRGQYQIRIQQLQPKGIGPLELAFRQLCSKLEQEGLFRPEIKRPIPRIPRRIALVTSPSGAAVRDFLEVALRRWPACDVVVVPVPVQGEYAAPAIASALANIEPLDVDLVALIRGGGSLEDLWAFNEEIVARAIRQCCRPVVTGVGHEVDVTIADLVADMRALTPTEAAERLFPDRNQLRQLLAQWCDRLCSASVRYLERRRQALQSLEAARPFQRPLEFIEDFSSALDDYERTLCTAVLQDLMQRRANLSTWANTLDALSPLQVLERGYTVTLDRQDRVVRSVQQLAVDDTVRLLLADGRAQCRVESVDEGEGLGSSPK